MLAACGSELSTDLSGAQSELQVTANVGMPATRANGATWEQDVIGITADPDNSSSVMADYRNVKFSTTSETTTADFTSDAPVYLADEDSHTFVAYGPYSADATTTVTVDASKQSDDAGRKAADLIWATGTATKSSPKLTLNFKHKMAKLTIQVKSGASIEGTVSLNSLLISSLYTSAMLDIDKGTVSATGYAPFWDILANGMKASATDVVTYTAILPPQSLKGKQIVLSSDNKNATVSLPDLTLESGKSYTIPLVIDNAFNVSISSAQITAWTLGEAKDITGKYWYPVPNAVDLGLTSGLLWADKNLGADIPEQDGNFYHWGEAVATEDYKMGNKYYTGYGISKYNDVDKLTTLEPIDDAATQLLGDGWRMPDAADFVELLNECTWTEETLNGLSVYKITSKKNSNYIYLPRTYPYYNPDGSLLSQYPLQDGYRSCYWTRNLSNSSIWTAACFVNQQVDYSFLNRNKITVIRAVKQP